MALLLYERDLNEETYTVEEEWARHVELDGEIFYETFCVEMLKMAG